MSDCATGPDLCLTELQSPAQCLRLGGKGLRLTLGWLALCGGCISPSGRGPWLGQGLVKGLAGIPVSEIVVVSEAVPVLVPATVPSSYLQTELQ